MANLSNSDLRDPSPPLPGAAERAAVATRAGKLVRRRRYAQGAGALGVVAAVAVGVAALTAGGTTTTPSAQHIEAANAPDAPARMTLPPDTTVAPAPEPATTTVAPAPVDPTQQVAEVPAPAPAPAAEVAATADVSGDVALEPGATLHLEFTGYGGNFSVDADAGGHYSLTGLPTGTYSVIATRTSASGGSDIGSAVAVVMATVTLVAGANVYSPAF
jgi:hypothetical protein